MRKRSRWLVGVGLVLALVLALLPTQVMAEPDWAVDPDGPYTNVPVGSTFTVDINVDNVVDMDSGQFQLEYDHNVIDIVNIYTDVRAGALLPVGTTVMMSEPDVDCVRVIFDALTYPYPGGGVTGSGCLIEIDFKVVGNCDDTSVLDLSSHAGPAPCPDDFCNGMWNNFAVKQASTWGDSYMTVEPCATPTPTPPPFEPVVVSGKQMPAGAGVTGGWVPPGYEPCDEFETCEMLYVWGYGFEYCQWYRLWIQPYEAGAHVAPGDAIDPSAVPPGFAPVEVHIDEEGHFGPIALWHVSAEYCQYFEIVADMMGSDNEGVYNPDEDGLDAVCLGEWGFHIYPEGLTIILLALGLAAVGGYLVVRRRRHAETGS
jgi:hypothetical protein